MNPTFVLDIDPDWLEEEDDDEDEYESLGELFIREHGTDGFTQIDSTHLPHFVALYEREDDLLN